MKNSHQSTVYHSSLLTLPKIHTEAGNITAINNQIDIPFDIKRVYYLFDVPSGESRGGHAHKELHQLIVAASGSFDIIIDDGKIKRTFHMARPNLALYLPPGLWRELDNFSSGSICLVLASHIYDEADYLRDYTKFLSWKKTL
jgi:oxalate decarboxylase/phosphoglucose isomerase-like protein (cupin superfamily)